MVAAEAQTLGTSEAYLRKLRQFADPRTGYTAEQLEDLCRLCKKSKRAVEITVILLLARVHDRRYDKLRSAFFKRAGEAAV